VAECVGTTVFLRNSTLMIDRVKTATVSCSEQIGWRVSLRRLSLHFGHYTCSLETCSGMLWGCNEGRENDW
jgi:hypothetical protein